MTPVMNRRHSNIPGYVLAVLGLIVCGIELCRHWLWDYPIGATPMAVSAILFFIGGSLIDAAKASAIAGVVVSSGIQVLNAMPGIGRRGYDKTTPPTPAAVIPTNTDAVIVVPGASSAPSKTDDESA